LALVRGIASSIVPDAVTGGWDASGGAKPSRLAQSCAALCAHSIAEPVRPTVSASARYGERVASHGLGGSHAAILAEVDDGSRVLDVGCASGYLAARLAARGCSVVGVEPDPASAAEAEAHCELVIVDSIDSERGRAAIDGTFDYVLFGDVLEHLVDPWETLRFARTLLAPRGVAIVSIPNVAAWPVRLGLLAGRFDYADLGLLDRTHLRFFTRRTAHELVRGAGFEIESERFVHLERAPGPLRRRLPLVTSIGDRMLARLLPGPFAQQFILRLRPEAPGRRGRAASG
jgi:2-polyprenyl-3-methyl-5-hydroxy-6-metoxy-1,4-benzoquinol methylase